MFTGIIETTGKILRIENQKITIGAVADSNFFEGMKVGMSIAINGICFTVISYDLKKSHFLVEAMPETFQKTNLGDKNLCPWVNLEKALPANGRFEGHIVQGHVDTPVKIMDIKKKGNSWIFKFVLPAKISSYVVRKGSIAINGISLTVIDACKGFFSAGIIPYTWEKTMLSKIKIGQRVNLETDIVAKYLEKMIKK